MKHGNGTKYWLLRGDNREGSGIRNAAKQWPLGASGKQNRFLARKESSKGDTVSSTHLSSIDVIAHLLGLLYEGEQLDSPKCFI